MVLEIRSVPAGDGTRLEYEIAGRGPPLVLLHGFLAGRRTFSRQLDVFAERFRLIVPSARGHDGSGTEMPPHYGPGSSDVDDLCAVLAAEQVDRADLVAHSSGGATAFVFACRSPDRVGRVVLIEPTLLGLLPSADAAPFVDPIEAAVAEAKLHGPMAGLRAILALLGAAAWAKLDEAAQAARLQSLTSIAPLVAPHFQGLLDLPVSEADVRGLRPPALLAYGAASFPFEQAIARRFARLRPDLGVHTIEGAGHIVHRDRADAFNALALPFLSSNQNG